ncbi:MAG: hypothetical protein LUH07_06855 [Lachnospiraceae bacterium]|nr:hypothetical protein [Lachnospiraceae bacterium]
MATTSIYNFYCIIDGEWYCILSSEANSLRYSTYKNVWFDDTHCASEVIIDARGNTTIIWSYDTQLEGNTHDSISYLTMVYSSTLERLYSDFDNSETSNRVYLNGVTDYSLSSTRYSARVSALYDEIATLPIVTGTLQKQILTSEEYAAEETYANTSQIDLNENNDYTQVVRYKLELNTSMANKSDTVFSKVIDILPYTYGVFNWEENVNVDVYLYTYADGSGEPDNIAYEIYYSDEDGTEIIETDEDGNYILDDGSPAYQSIRWIENGDYQITVPGGTGGVWIYVELTFQMTATEWEQYANEVSGNLRNTLSAVIGDNSEADTAAVTHSVRKDSKAYLQKGVLEICAPDSWLRDTFSGTDAREVYYNASGETDGSSVAYYITIYNPSSANLYLTEIQDLVPEGFTLTGLCGGLDAYESGNLVSPDTSTVVVTDSSSPATSLAVENVTWMNASVDATVDDETGIVRYEFSQFKTLTNIKYSEELGCCYLAQYEAISFIVVFDPGTAAETEDDATNTIGMPYVDVSGSGVTVVDADGTAKVLDGLEETAQNVGVCSLYSETEAAEIGFESEEQLEEISAASETQWLVSDVTVHRGEIIPGIKKTVEESAEFGVNGDDSVTWTIEVTNTGTVPMVNYTITDTIDAPYQISGNVYLTIYDKDGNAFFDTS